MEDESLPESDVGKEYKLNQMATEGLLDSSFAKSVPNDTILRLQRTTPYYKASLCCIHWHSLHALAFRLPVCITPRRVSTHVFGLLMQSVGSSATEPRHACLS